MSSVSTFAPRLLPMVVTLATALSGGTADSGTGLPIDTVCGSYVPRQIHSHISLSQGATAWHPESVQSFDNENSHELPFPVAADWINAAIAKLTSYEGVKNGWKGENTLAPNGATLIDAIDLVFQFASEAPALTAPLLSLDEDGYVSIYWNHGHMMASVMVYGDGTYSYYAEGRHEAVRSDSMNIGEPLPDELLMAMLPQEQMAS